MKFLFETELVLDLDLICAAGQSWYSKGRRRRRKLYSLSSLDKKINAYERILSRFLSLSHIFFVEYTNQV